MRGPLIRDPLIRDPVDHLPDGVTLAVCPAGASRDEIEEFLRAANPGMFDPPGGIKRQDDFTQRRKGRKGLDGSTDQPINGSRINGL